MILREIFKHALVICANRCNAGSPRVCGSNINECFTGSRRFSKLLNYRPKKRIYNSLPAWVKRLYPPISIKKGVLNCEKKMPVSFNQIPPFPGFENIDLDAVQAAELASEFKLSKLAVDSVRHAMLQGSVPADIAMLRQRISEHALLQMQFRDFSLEAQMCHDPEILNFDGVSVRNAMQRFMDRNSELPPVAQLMPHLGSLLVCHDQAVAKKLQTLNRTCNLYLGTAFPFGALSSSNKSIVAMTEHQIEEAVSSLPLVLGKERAASIIHKDLKVLVLPPQLIERMVKLLQTRLELPALAEAQDLVLQRPGLLHTTLYDMRKRFFYLLGDKKFDKKPPNKDMVGNDRTMKDIKRDIIRKDPIYLTLTQHSDAVKALKAAVLAAVEPSHHQGGDVLKTEQRPEIEVDANVIASISTIS
ncbi:hypothetical protein CEUSTIGMA_g3918.t1 [Chlamydomonas eustigma]|uniref:Uncharacterized protein n=1 Tax=Chlamydomonas eustigma TaxID=1157962 RepID=A0A250X070_9CHLO|nr:hypothetical protein CEUSTIGMA_g3918.t1 [Chlamydomonas eustigma]|eukprot:GAX76473.1 hypothetical protein CEUSTIGMA_g3918.t1 [Chlamydomonas eustigma]